MRAKEIANYLAQRAETVAQYLLPKGKRIGQEWRVGSILGEEGSSLGIHLSVDKAGVWSDFATGISGDFLDLWCAVRQISLKEAIKEAKKWLGIESPCFESPKKQTFQKPIKESWQVLDISSAIGKYLINERLLFEATLKAYQIAEKGREIVFPFIRDNELIQVKYLAVERPNGKKQIRVETNCEPCLFGWQAIPSRARFITLTEGEIDAMTLYQYGIPALSLPFGGGTGAKHQWLAYEFDRLAIYDEVYLCLDNDEVGQAACFELVERLGCHRCRIVKLPYKDANASLQAGLSTDDIKQCFENAVLLDPQELKQARYYAQQVIEEFYPQSTKQLGIEPPWDKAKGKIRFRPDELSVWTGINGHGKSQFLGQIILQSLKKGSKVCIASLELKPKRLLMRLTRQAAGIANPTEEYIQAIHEWYGDYLWLFDLVGTAKAERLLEVFNYARQRYGIDVFVIDSLMKCDIAEDDYRAQKAFLEKLCDFKNEYSCHVHIVIHPRKGANEGQVPGKLDTKGSGAISDLADNCFTIWRNKSKEEAIQKLRSQKAEPDKALLEQIDCVWQCDKQRNGDWEGKIGLWFDPASYQYLNSSNQKPKQWVAFSQPITPRTFDAIKERTSHAI